MNGKLTEREESVWKAFASSATTKQIAGDLNVSPKTIEYHRSNLYKKLGVNDYAALTRLAIRNGLIQA